MIYEFNIGGKIVKIKANSADSAKRFIDVRYNLAEHINQEVIDIEEPADELQEEETQEEVNTEEE